MDSTTTTSRDIAADYLGRGWKPIPIPYKEKGPIIPGWQHLRLHEAELPNYFNGKPQNVGILLGQISGIADADLDHSLAVELADEFLTPTNSEFGRKSKPRSHREYKVKGPCPSIKWKYGTGKDETICELRADARKADGANQTVFPGSVHPSGERIEWNKDSEPAEIDAGKLRRHLHALAVEVARRLDKPLIVEDGTKDKSKPSGGADIAAQVKTAALGRAVEILEHVAGIPPDVLDGRHHPCPKPGCGGTDRFRLIDEIAGAVLCNQCFNLNNGDFLAAVQWYRGCDFRTALKLCAEYLGVSRAAEPKRRSRAKPTITSDGTTLDLREPAGRTDSANALRFTTENGAIVRYCDPWGKWLVWDAKRFAIDKQRVIESLAKNIGASVWSQVAKLLPEVGREVGDELIRFAHYTASAKGIANMLALARSEAGIPVLPELLDSHGWLLNCLNGIIDLKTGALLPHDRKYLLTKIAGAEYVTGTEGECPLWENAVETISGGDVSLIRFKQRLYGAALVGQVLDHILPIFWGDGSNGKSLEAETMIEVFGEYGDKASSDLLLVKNGEAHPTEKADLFGKRLVFAVETDSDRRLSEALTKELTGGDSVKARRMREDFWSFKPSHTVILITNHRPRVKGTDHGIWRRLALIPYTKKFWDEGRGEAGPPELKADTGLKGKLVAEYGGILNWLVQGCLAWQREGLGQPEQVRAATTAYRGAEDTLAQCIAECCVELEGVTVKASALRERYEKWCDENGHKPMGGRAFGEAIANRGIEKRLSGGTWYVGIGLVAVDL